MVGDGLLIGEVAKRSGASRKALRLYERAGILPATRRTEAGYRVFGADVLDLVASSGRHSGSASRWRRSRRSSRSSDQGVYHAHTFMVWYHGSGRTSIAGLRIWQMSASGCTRCSEAGGRGAEPRLRASTSSRAAIRVIHPTTFATHEGGSHDPSNCVDTDYPCRRCRLRGDRADAPRRCMSADTRVPLPMKPTGASRSCRTSPASRARSGMVTR